MANNHCLMTANSLLSCSSEDYDRLEIDFGETLSAAGILTGFSVTGEHVGLHFYSEFGIDQEVLEKAEDLRKFVGSLIKKAGLEYWEFGEAFYCDKARVGSCGGALFRWMKDGRVVWAQYVYPDFIKAVKELTIETNRFLSGDHIWAYHRRSNERSKLTRKALGSLQTAMRRVVSFPWTAIKDSKNATTDGNT